jgi:hypothetical protein
VVDGKSEGQRIQFVCEAGWTHSKALLRLVMESVMLAAARGWGTGSSPQAAAAAWSVRIALGRSVVIQKEIEQGRQSLRMAHRSPNTNTRIISMSPIFAPRGRSCQGTLQRPPPRLPL